MEKRMGLEIYVPSVDCFSPKGRVAISVIGVVVGKRQHLFLAAGTKNQFLAAWR